MRKLFSFDAICVLSLLFMTCPGAAFADPITTQIYSTSTFVLFNSLTGVPVYSYNGPNVVNGSSTTSYTGSNSYDGYNLSVSGYASADRDTLHSSSSYTLVGGCSCTAPEPSQAYWGIQTTANVTEYGAQAATIGPPDLLAGIDAFKVTFGVDGSIQYLYQGASFYIEAGVTQNGTTTWTVDQAYAPPLGPVSFYIQPPNPNQPFNVEFVFGTDTLSGPQIPGAPNEDSVDFPDTATLLSIQGVDANHNVIAGTFLEGSDGTILGADNTPVTSTVPEPSSWILTGGGISIIRILQSLRRRFGPRTQ